MIIPFTQAILFNINKRTNNNLQKKNLVILFSFLEFYYLYPLIFNIEYLNRLQLLLGLYLHWLSY